MPYIQAAVEKANLAFGRNNIGNIDPAWFSPGQDLAMGMSLAAAANPATTARDNFTNEEQTMISRFPSAIKEAVRATIHSSLTDPVERVPVQFVWMPAYDFEVTITSVPGIPDSRGGISVLVKSRYATDLKIPGTE